MTYDYLIIGQGICGTFLSYYLRKAGSTVLVIDEPQPFSASKVASGVINPVTGRRVVTVWMADELMDFCREAYQEIGVLLNEEVIKNLNILSFPPSQQMTDTYRQRSEEQHSYINMNVIDQDYSDWFSYIFQPVEITPSYLVNIHPLIAGWRKLLRGKSALLEENFDESRLMFENEQVLYKDIKAGKVIYCNGTAAYGSAYWKNLPSVYNKGEAVIADIPGLPEDKIYKFGATTLVPWYDGLWWVGSSYDNEFADALPTDAFKKQKERELGFILRKPFRIIDHVASVRPATIERRPFVGFHPVHPSIGILNGMGTKGCSLAPYFAQQFSAHLTRGEALSPEADVKRFQKILSINSVTKN